MSILSSWKITAIALLAGIAIGWYVQGLRWDADIVEMDRQTSAANEQRAEAVTANVISSMRILNIITQVNADAKQQIQQKAETRIVYIRQALSGDNCATQPVPVDAVNRLREHADRIRSSSDSTDSDRVAD